MGILTLVQRASAHSRYQANLLAEEYSRWGLNYHRSEIAIRRAEKEFEVSDYILIPSDFVRKSFIDQGISEEKLVQIPFGVDIKRFKPESNRNNRSKFRVLFAGQISIRKGVGYLLEAWKELNWEDAELCLVGRVNKDFRTVLKKYILLPGLKLVGHVHNPVNVFQSSDIFAFPTIEEGSALVTYEALACGLPVITTPNAGSIVRNGEDGFLIPIRDVSYLVEKLKLLRHDHQLRKKMSQSARKRTEKFSWDKHGDILSKRLGELVINNKMER
jgi:glycosyltransferase involved in cell wall biosynthesis